MCLGELHHAADHLPGPDKLHWRLDAVAAPSVLQQGIFSGFPIYLPELYPTRLRVTGASVCFNTRRVLACASPFLTGWLVKTLGTFSRTASIVALVYLIGTPPLTFFFAGLSLHHGCATKSQNADAR
jgi:hypothetical protein